MIAQKAAKTWLDSLRNKQEISSREQPVEEWHQNLNSSRRLAGRLK
jgi:hypothetical protein